MNLVLDAHEARVIGCLIEKEITTPDQYPLSLNALVNACNQKSNRDPVVEWSETDLQAVVDRLSAKHLVLERSGFGSRVVKYRHVFCNGDHSPRQYSRQQLAVLCELLLRGPQTPGELRARCQRLAPIAGLADIEAALDNLKTRADGPYVVQLPRAPGAREARFRHLFGGPEAEAAAGPPDGAADVAPGRASLAERVALLEAAVADLQSRLQAAGIAPAGGADGTASIAPSPGDP